MAYTLPALISAWWPTFRERAEQAGGLPGFVVDEIEGYLRCGIVEHGVAHLACRRCGHSMVVAFSCKGRGFCPSCTGRRMADLAAHLVDEVLPKVAIRQWVCSLPWLLRVPMAYDRALCGDVLAAFVGALQRLLRQRAKRALGLRSVEAAEIGAVTFVQRCDSALRLDVHFHTLALDGVYVRDESGALQFHRLPDPTPEEVVQVATWVHERLARVLERHGRSLDGHDDAPSVLADEEPALASLYDASAADRQLLGDAPGQATRKLVRATAEVLPQSEALADVGGVNVHAGAAIDGRDRKRLERLCRYIARPPLAQERLEEHGDGRLRYRFKRPWRNGTYAVVLEPLDLVARLVALVPPPRFHMLRYHGVLAAHAKARAEVVPGRAASASSEPVQLKLGFEAAHASEVESEPASTSERASRHPWAWLLARVFAVDVTVCPRCAGRMRLLKLATTREDISKALAHAGLGPRPPPRPRLTMLGQLELRFAAA